MANETPPFVSGTPLQPHVLQGPLLGLAGRDAPLPARQRVARAAVPAPPDALVPALLFLTQDLEPEIRKLAKESLASMPIEVLGPVVAAMKDPALVDAAARAMVRIPKAARAIALNAYSDDDTLRWMASAADTETVLSIGRNHVRALRYPAIIEAIYLNPLAPQSLVQDLFGLAVRSGVNLDHVPGFREAKAMLVGEEPADEEKGLSDAEFASAMLMAIGQGERAIQLVDSADGSAQAEREAGSLAALLSRMSVAQKIRIAMVGDAATRKLLIRDPKKMVAFAVLKSPRLTEGEITAFASNKALSEDILASIARNRQWTKDYATRKALVFNPKTPLSLSMQFLRTLSAKDMKDCSGSRDVNPNVARTAKRILTEASEKKG